MRTKKAYALAIPVAVMLGACEQPAEPKDLVFPGAGWEKAEPSAVGLDSAKLSDALSYLASHSGADQLLETIVVKDGYVVFAGDSTHRRHNIYSSSKCFTSTALGLLIEDGEVALDDAAARYEPLLIDAYPSVTLRHFTTMTSGYSAVGASRWNEPSEDWGWTPYQPDEPLFAPGTAYAYWDEAQMMFGRVLVQAAGVDLREYLHERIMQPIGIRDAWTWGTEDSLTHANGQTIPIRNGCTGVMLTAKELARVGLLFANHGVWEGDTLVPATWVEQATSPQVPADLPVAQTDRSNVRGSGVYGYNWWTAAPSASADWSMPGVPEDAAYMSGFNHNVCLVVPSERLVIVRMGEDGNPEAGKHAVYAEVLRRLF